MGVMLNDLEMANGEVIFSFLSILGLVALCDFSIDRGEKSSSFSSSIFLSSSSKRSPKTSSTSMPDRNDNAELEDVFSSSKEAGIDNFLVGRRLNRLCVE